MVAGAVALVAQLAFAQRLGSIDGLVTDTSLRALAGASVSVSGLRAPPQTAADGRFSIPDAPAGEYVVKVQRIGYASVAGVIVVEPGNTTRVTYSLEKVSVALDTIRVLEHWKSQRMLDLERRQRSGQGEFITRDKIERRNAVYATDLIRTLTGLKVVPSGGKGGMMGNVALSFRGKAAGPCPTQILVDGIAMPQPFNLDELPPPGLIEAIESYTGPAALTPELGGAKGRWCGVIAVWTREAIESRRPSP